MRDPTDVRAHQLQLAAERIVDDLTRSRCEDGADHGEQRALARSVWPLQEGDAACVEARTHCSERWRRAEKPRDRAHLDALDHARNSSALSAAQSVRIGP